MKSVCGKREYYYLELNIKIAQNGSWHAGELFEQICEQFKLEGYEQVELSGRGGAIILNRERTTLVGVMVSIWKREKIEKQHLKTLKITQN
ncbi:hypothetical protein HYE54_01140 [Aggregatibacter actinomycetemcomitans]|uniref:hypothetical protein n=1 Tax=Aggregatibacter actinomycetemcomitans TaxID=714 RepID=UPI00197C2E75|nr:hypothetical protein [Aggregatibacter actinomycetemcomitans]MBN6067423.1 hypothetical protein [Aggregatibacter actinomycetemcomitans]